MRTVLYASPFVPPEWIAAHGFAPSRITPRDATGDADVPPEQGMCHFMWSTVCEVNKRCDAAGAIFTTICDQMRRAPEVLEQRSGVPVFLFHVPKTWRETSSRAYYASELRRMGEFLVTLGGVSPSCDGLSQIMHSYDDERRRIVSMRKLRSSREFSEILMRFYIGGTANVSDSESTDLEEAVAVAIVGGPLAPKDFALFDLIAGAGGKVVLDGTENGERTLPGTFDPARTRRNPVDELVRAYFDTIPDIFRRPNDGFYVWICRETQQRHVKGVIFLRHVWCDLWQAELHRLRSSLPLPVLDLECDGGIVSDRWGARVDAFIESLR